MRIPEVVQVVDLAPQHIQFAHKKLPHAIIFVCFKQCNRVLMQVALEYANPVTP